MNTEYHNNFFENNKDIPDEPVFKTIDPVEDRKTMLSNGIKEIIKEMILSGEIGLKLYEEEVYSNEGFYCGDRTKVSLTIDNEVGYSFIMLKDVEIDHY